MLKRNSTIFKIAYGLSVKAPSQTSRCALFWRVVSMMLVVWPFCVIFGVGVTLIVSIFSFLIAAERPALLPKDPQVGFVPIKHWPVIRGHRVWPSLVLISGALLFYAPLWLGWLSQIANHAFQELVHVHGSVTTIVLVLVIVLAALYYFMRWIKTSGVWQLTQDYLMDRKKKFCPMIPIEPEVR